MYVECVRHSRIDLQRSGITKERKRQYKGMHCMLTLTRKLSILLHMQCLRPSMDPIPQLVRL